MGLHTGDFASAGLRAMARAGQDIDSAQKSRIGVRRYDVAALGPDGAEHRFARAFAAAPATLDAAFTAFARGTVFATQDGPTAVEDLAPGMMLDTVDAGPRRLLWVGSTLLAPESDQMAPDMPRLTRISADSLGLGRPSPDLILGPCARLMVRDTGAAAVHGAQAALAPASAFVDGVAFVALHAVRPTRLYHLGFSAQHILLANGVEVESYHPGENPAPLMDAAGQARFLSLFPHVEGFAGFGPAPLPRLTAFEAESLRAA